MTEQTQELLSMYIKNGVDFVLEQAPDICSQIINVGFINNCIGLVSFIIVAVILINFGKFCNKKMKSADWINKDEWNIGKLLSYIVGTIAPTIGILVNLYNIAYIYFCPKLYLIEYFSSLLKGH